MLTSCSFDIAYTCRTEGTILCQASMHECGGQTHSLKRALLKEQLPPAHLELTQRQQVALSRDLEFLCRNLCQEKMPYEIAARSAEILVSHMTPEQLLHIKVYKTTEACPYLLIRRLVTTNNLPLTPSDDRAPKAEGWRLQAAAILGMLKVCGFSPASFLDEMGGRLFHMVMPAWNTQKSFHRSTKALNLHTEVVNGYFSEDNPNFGAPFSPDSFGLICLRNPDSIPTTILPTESILKKLGEDTLHELTKKNFKVRSQSSFDREIILDDMAVMSLMSNGLLGMRYSHSKLTANCAASQRALSELKTAIQDSLIISLALEGGDVLIINNRICLHGRSGIPAVRRPDGRDRWLVRIYGYNNLSMRKIKFDPIQTYAMCVDR